MRSLRFASLLRAIFRSPIRATSRSRGAPPTPRGRTRRRSKGDLCRDGQIHFGAFAEATLQMKLRSDSLGGLPHPGESPVTLTTVAQNLQFDSASVVSHKEAQVAVAITQLHFDIRGP